MRKNTRKDLTHGTFKAKKETGKKRVKGKHEEMKEA